MPLKCMTIKESTEKQCEQCFSFAYTSLWFWTLALNPGYGSRRAAPFSMIIPDPMRPRLWLFITSSSCPVHQPASLICCQPSCLNNPAKWLEVCNVSCKWVQVLISTSKPGSGLCKSHLQVTALLNYHRVQCTLSFWGQVTPNGAR